MKEQDAIHAICYLVRSVVVARDALHHHGHYPTAVMTDYRRAVSRMFHAATSRWPSQAELEAIEPGLARVAPGPEVN